MLIGKFDGLADTDDEYAIVIMRDLDTKAGLETVVHEALHAGAWSKSEEVVGRTAREIARLLWRLGYRLK